VNGEFLYATATTLIEPMKQILVTQNKSNISRERSKDALQVASNQGQHNQ
jgi:hypothetical protein